MLEAESTASTAGNAKSTSTLNAPSSNPRPSDCVVFHNALVRPCMWWLIRSIAEDSAKYDVDYINGA